MPPVRDDTKYPIWLGAPTETVADSKVELPSGWEPRVPSDVDLKYDFAEYHASYSQDHGVLFAKNRLLIKQHEVPVAEFDDYRNFVKKMQNDIAQYVQTTWVTEPSVPNSTSPANAESVMNSLRGLPGSDSSDATRLLAEASVELTNHDLQGAVSSMQRAVVADPKFARGWVFLGQLLFSQKQYDAGIEAFHKAMAAAPDQSAIAMALGFSLMASSQFADAVPVWQDYMKAHPDDADGPSNLGNCLIQLKRYSEAVTAYELAAKIRGDRPNLQMRLGSAYLLAGDRQKAKATFTKLAELDPKGTTFNDAAYHMANADLELPLALDYAKKAVRNAEDDSAKITLPEMKTEDLRKIFTLAAYWDTLGWVDERMSNLGEAEAYLRAAWKLTQDGVVAGHLCHLYRREHKDAAAVQNCRVAISRMSMSKQLGLSQYQIELDAAKENLTYLTGAAKTNNKDDASDLVVHEREFKLPRFLPGTESAEFFVLLGSDGKSKKFKVEDVQFISGSDKMKLQGKQLRTIDFNVPAPDENPTRFVRRGILGCYQYTGCSFVLLDPTTVTSLY